MAINNELLKMARAQVNKLAFIAAGDPSMGGGAPADPAMGGGAPPMDPAMGGGAPPMDPAMGGGAPADPMAALQPMIDQSVQAALAAQGGGAPAGGGGAKAAKPDVAAELKALKQQMAKVMDIMGVTMTPSEVYGDEQEEQAAPAAAPAPAEAAGGALGSISPMEPMKAAQDEWEHGVAFTPPVSHDFVNAQAVNKSMSELATALLATKR